MSSPYPSLQTMDLPSPAIWEIKPSPSLQAALETRFKPLQTTYPGMIRFGKTKKYSPFLRFDHMWHLEEFISDVPQRSGPFSGKVRAYRGGQPQSEFMDVSGFCKITHLLDAYKMIQGDYPMSQHPALPSPGRKSAKVYSKIHDPHNQAYVDTVACYMLSKFREADHSPHFSLFYGAYLAIAKDYYYNITEDFPELRFENWFWRKKSQGLFRLVGFQGPRVLDVNDPLMEKPETLSEGSFNSTSSSRTNSISELNNSGSISVDESESLHSASIKTRSSDTSSRSTNSNADTEISDSSYESDELGKDYAFYAAISEFPTMIMYLESNKATMDSLLEEDCPDMNVKVGTKEWESQWTAWLFQVIAALCQIQSLWAMTHNDLHSNNILWTPTDKEFLYYECRDGRMWRVPTYGKLFRIIDFGRAIYTHNSVLCISDDYWPENEAGSQYNFGPLYNPKEPRVYPNPSFDLCRLSVSIIEALFLEIPADKEGGKILSSEIDRVQNETVSELFNMMWEWLIDDDGRNVLWDIGQSERYPGFDLYRIIAQKVKNAIPYQQLNNPIFAAFHIDSKNIPSNQKVYSLFS